MKFSMEDKKEVSSKLMDLANLILAAVTFGQAFTAHSGKGIIAAGGAIIFLSLYGIAIFLRKRR